MKVNYSNLGTDGNSTSTQLASGSSSATNLADSSAMVHNAAENEDDTATYRRKRPKLGKLPSFIPID